MAAKTSDQKADDLINDILFALYLERIEDKPIVVSAHNFVDRDLVNTLLVSVDVQVSRHDDGSVSARDLIYDEPILSISPVYIGEDGLHFSIWPARLVSSAIRISQKFKSLEDRTV
jgi:hypothetical protein